MSWGQGTEGFRASGGLFLPHCRATVTGHRTNESSCCVLECCGVDRRSVPRWNEMQTMRREHEHASEPSHCACVHCPTSPAWRKGLPCQVVTFNPRNWTHALAGWLLLCCEEEPNMFLLCLRVEMSKSLSSCTTRCKHTCAFPTPFLSAAQ